MNKNIVTVVNFIRSADRRNDYGDMFDAVKNQVELARKYKMPTTFLLQNDVMVDEKMLSLIPNEDYVEVGLWLELNRTLVTRAGGEWKSDDEWDWRSNFDLSCAYPCDVRKRMIDIAMNDFKDYYGYYPKTVGSWEIDAVTLKYLADNYDVSASLNCKDQWGTDGYSLWGGYFSGAYYPTVNNAFCPANEIENQINIPVFRMLGCDPIDQYDCESDHNGQNVVTMEPVYKDGGGHEQWVRRFMRELTENEPLSYSYVQVGQENAFGWSNMSDGYTMQMRIMDELSKSGKIELMTMKDAGEWYKKRYAETPASVSFSSHDGKCAIWYSCKNYRFGVFANDKLFYVRDITLFRDGYKERYLDDTCKTMNSYYDNLPFVDGYRWSETPKNGGLFFFENGEKVTEKAQLSYEKLNDTSICVTVKRASGEERIILCEDKITFETKCSLHFAFDENSIHPEMKFMKDRIELSYNGHDYSVGFDGESEDRTIKSKDGRIVFKIV